MLLLLLLWTRRVLTASWEPAPVDAHASPEGSQHAWRLHRGIVERHDAAERDTAIRLRSAGLHHRPADANPASLLAATGFRPLLRGHEQLSNVTMRLSVGEAQLWLSNMLASRSYLEWGAGGSTVLAAWRSLMGPSMPAFSASVVESSAAWLQHMRTAYPAFAQAEAARTLRVYRGDVGETGAWGQPLNFSSLPSAAIEARARPYVQAVGEDECCFDMIFIDGRFREACAVHALSLAHNHTLVLMHDYPERRYFRTMQVHFDHMQSQGQLAVFRPKASSLEQRQTSRLRSELASLLHRPNRL